MEAREARGLSDISSLGHVNERFWLISTRLCRSASKLHVHVQNIVTEGLKG
jgi:hypothetical protein